MSDRATFIAENAAIPSMHCVCGHWDTDHAAFTSKIRPGRTRTFCDHCDCQSWMTPEHRAEIEARRSRATVPIEPNFWAVSPDFDASAWTEDADRDDIVDSDGRLAPKGLR